MAETIDTRVERGFAFLTDRLGPGWWNIVDVDRLELDDCFTCVLGQLAPALGAVNVPPDYANLADDADDADDAGLPYDLAIDALGWDDGRGEVLEHGFSLHLCENHLYSELTMAWRRWIVAARDAEQVTA